MPIKEKSECLETSLYKGKVLVKFYPGPHAYYVNGERQTGVTTLIGIIDKSRALMSWKGTRTVDFLLKQLKKGAITKELICVASNIDEIEKEEAARVGTAIHAWCENYIKAKLKIKGYTIPDMPEEKAVQVAVNAFLDWEKEHKVKFVSSERMVYSKKYKYIGTMDIEAYVDGELCLCDLKSSNGLYNTVRLQTAAYLRADEEERGKKLYSGRWAIRLAKFDEAEYFERETAKKEIRKMICKYLDKEYKETPIAPYQAFEAKYLDEKKGDLDYDFEDGFLSAVKLFRWNKETDFFYNK